jgi:ABC-type multidrug transport system fused ATPase/permease subunit
MCLSSATTTTSTNNNVDPPASIQNDDNMSWPEEDFNRQSILTIIKDRLFYAYMNQILQKGNQLDKQRKALKKRQLNRTRHGHGENSIGTSSNGNGNGIGIDTSTNGGITDEGENNHNHNNDNSANQSSSSSSSSSSFLEQKEMSHDDLFKAPQSMQSQHLINEFNAAYTKMKKDIMIQSPTSEKNRRKELRWMFMKTLWTISKPTYIPAGLSQLVTVLVQTSTPIVVQRLLLLFQNNPNSSILSTEGVIYAVALFLCSIVDGIAQERHKFLAFQSGITIRAAAVNAIYNQMLNLSAKGKENLLSGETTSLVAIDCQKLFEVYQEGHLIWSCPLSMIIVTILLLLTLGKSTLVGMTSMFLMVPLVKFVISRMMLIRRKRASYTDKRVEVTTSMLQAIRFCKLNHYEQKFIERVHEARKMEMIWVRKELSMLGWTLCITVLTPVIASALTFITYVLIDDENILTSAETFTTLLLFSALRFPINYVGKLIGKAALGIEACQRIADFLDRDITDTCIETKDMNLDNVDQDYFIHVENGCFTVGSKRKDESSLDVDSKESTAMMKQIETPKPSKASFTISNVNFKVKKSEVFCVVGQVASGKSTLLNALIGDVESDSDQTKINIQGKISYASQSPFILNTTFRENILFGSEYNKELYDSVILACNLLPDLKQLGPAGDLTEIGERGVTLSGGQKARISIARCVYAQPSVALFDDILSALDASTGKWIFERLFDTSTKKQRLLSNSAVVLVTHASHFLSRVDNIMVLNRGQPVYVGNWDGLNENLLVDDQEAKDLIRSLRSSVQELQENSSNTELKAEINDVCQSNIHDHGDNIKVEESNSILMTGKIFMLLKIFELHHFVLIFTFVEYNL